MREGLQSQQSQERAGEDDPQDHQRRSQAMQPSTAGCSERDQRDREGGDSQRRHPAQDWDIDAEGDERRGCAEGEQEETGAVGQSAGIVSLGRIGSPLPLTPSPVRRLKSVVILKASPASGKDLGGGKIRSPRSFCSSLASG